MRETRDSNNATCYTQIYTCRITKIISMWWIEVYDGTLTENTFIKNKAVTSSLWKIKLKENISVTLYNLLTIAIKRN